MFSHMLDKHTSRSKSNDQAVDTHDDWNVCVISCFSSPRWLMVKMRKIGMPTARYAHTSCTNRTA